MHQAVPRTPARAMIARKRIGSKLMSHCQHVMYVIDRRLSWPADFDEFMALWLWLLFTYSVDATALPVDGI